MNLNSGSGKVNIMLINLNISGKIPPYASAFRVSSCMCRIVCGEFKNEGREAVVGYFEIPTKASSQL